MDLESKSISWWRNLSVQTIKASYKHCSQFVGKAAICLLWLGAATPVLASDLVITGVVDGPLSGGVPKAIEVCVLNDIPDLSIYGLGAANNGGGSDGEEFTFPAGPVSAGTFLYVASEAAGFSAFFGFAPSFTSGAASINGDDAIELFMSGGVVDIYGDIDTDGSGEPWEYMDGWAYRDDGTGPDGTVFVPANWAYSGPNALDGETSNDTAATPFPIGAYSSCELPVPAPDLLLSEIVVTPTNGEFVEIYNPTGTSINLSDVYLTDATFSSGGVFYYNIVTGANAGGGGFGDFHARFPDGSTIAPGEFQTVSISGSDAFLANFGIDPTYELFEDAVVADGIPDMREALPGSINGQGGLSNSGEVVILYTWDGVSDLVQDIDYGLWGDKAEAVDKTGVSIDGPDPDAIASTYLADTIIPSQDVIFGGSHASGDSFQRVDFTEGAETQSGGNGLTGSDETSEDLSATWSLAAATPGAAPAADWVINEILADPASGLSGDANGDGVRHFSDDEFVELVNVSGAAMDISGWTLSDGFTVRHTFPAGTVIPDQCGFVVFGGGTPSGSFGNMTVQIASSGALSLNNGGDGITLNDGLGDVATASYGSEGGDNQSLTLDPDLTGALPWVKHSVASGSGGALFSPGTRVDGANFSGCPSNWAINEIHADPASGLPGDANGDGVRSGTSDEFVEIVNVNGSPVDISGWTLADGFSVRHTFPAGTVIPDQCSIVVFGGGTPTGNFGGSTVQTASTGSMGLNNSGDTLTLNNGFIDISMVSYGSEGGDNQSLTRDPDVTGLLPWVKHSVATGSGGALFSPGTLIDGSQFIGCPLLREIFEVQGSGASSPDEGSIVFLPDNVVTALDTNGFFIQTPTERSDGDPATSDGIFVFTVTPPTVAEGDRASVTGTVVEFFEFTEISSVTLVDILSSGNPLPAAVNFDASTPGPSPSPQEVQLERFEGMLVSFEGIATAPSDRFGDVPVVTQPARSFREPGVEFPGLFLPPIPTWDGNPEVFDLDPDGLGGPDFDIFANQAVQAEGPLGYAFGDYQVLPKTLTLGPEPLMPLPVRPRNPGELTVGSLNMFRFFADADDVLIRNAKFVSYILDVLDAPDILAVQEVGTIEALQALAVDINAVDPGVNYTAYLEEGNDIGGIDVGFMVRDLILVDNVIQLGKDETFIDPTDDSVDILHDRPPLLLEGRCQLAFGTYPISVMVVHNRSLSRIDDPFDGERVRFKRLSQAESIAIKVQGLQTVDPDVRLVVIGDFNAFEFTDGYVDSVAVISGDFDPATSFVCYEAACSTDLVEPDLDNQVLGLDASERYSFIFGGNAQSLDHALTSQKLAAEISGTEFGRGNSDVPADLINDDGIIDPANLPLRSSDHDGMVVFIAKDEDADGVPNDLDICPGTQAPEQNVPTDGVLGSNRWALLDDEDPLIFDQALPQGGSKASYTLGDTAGCSCEQIIDAQGLGNGHTKFGCSNSAMETWTELVALP